MTDVRLLMGHPGRFKAVMDGRVQSEGIALKTSTLSINDLFRVIPESDDFDVAELSTTALLWGIAQGRDWIALPIFTAWSFASHADTLCHVGSGIEKPQDLKGKRVGVPEYPVAAILWIREALEQKYGVRPQDIRWVEERTFKQSHYRGAGYVPPKEVPVEPIPAGRNLAEMLIAGELDAVIRYLEKPKQMSLAELGSQPSVRWLYPDRKMEAIAHVRAQGCFDPIHLMIMKKSLAQAHPELPMALVRAFERAHWMSDDPNVVVPMSYALSPVEQRELAGEGYTPVGVKAHRKALERLVTLAHREGYTPGGPLPVERVFHESTLGT